MAKEYNPQEHSFITVRVPKDPKLTERFKGELKRPIDGITGPADYLKDLTHEIFGPHQLLIHTGKYVFLVASHEFVDVWKDAVLVTDVRSSSVDDYCGACILSVPAEWCEFYDGEEAQHIACCIEADRKLLGYARG